MDRRFILTVDLAISADEFSFLITLRVSTVHPQEARHSISGAYPTCQHHCSCAWSSQSKIWATGTQAWDAETVYPSDHRDATK